MFIKFLILILILIFSDINYTFMYSIYCTQYTVQCTLYIVHSTLYTVHNTLYMLGMTLYSLYYNREFTILVVYNS